jgi:antirestriction protein ArdC
MTKRTPTAPRADIYQEVTDHIIALLESGCRPWSRSWASGAASLPHRHGGEAYQGINVLLLWAQSMLRGYRNPVFMTFKQALALGACVRKGERGAMVVYAGSIAPKDSDNGEAEGDSEQRGIPFLKRYTVFNVEQIDGLPEGKYPTPEPVVQNRDERDGDLDRAFAAYGVEIREQDGGAYYQDKADRITMPLFESFTSGNAFFATLAHEAIHSSGHKTRLDRDTLHRYGESIAIRAREELIAEIGAAMLCAALGMEPTEREDHAAYVENWLNTLRGDKRAIFQAASAAQAASNFILSATSSLVATASSVSKAAASTVGR